jgi:flagella basal body P-ring formation protein FlgA
MQAPSCRRCAALAAAICTLSFQPAAAAQLRPFSQITGSVVHLADLFDELGSTPDRVLGRAPLPGARIVVGAPQLAAIARDFDVDWRPATGSERAVVERRGDVLPRDIVLSALRRALLDAGAPADIDIAAPDLQDIMVPAGSTVRPEISQLSYDPARGNFTAQIGIVLPDQPAAQIHLSGSVIAMQQSLVAARRLSAGSILTSADVAPMRVRAALLHGAAPLSPGSAVGRTLRHDMAAGAPIGSADVAKTLVVQRGDRVRMSLVSDGLALTAQGIAAEAGARGDRIRIENPVSHRMVDGEVIGADEIRVAPLPATISLATAQ